MRKTITVLLMFVFLANFVYADCSFILPGESEDEPFHVYNCIDITPVYFGRIETNIEKMDMNLFNVDDPNRSLLEITDNGLQSYSSGNIGGFVNNLSYSSGGGSAQQQKTYTLPLTSFLRYENEFTIGDRNTTIIFPRFSLYR